MDGLGRFVKQFAPDQHAADFTCARANFVQLGVAPQATGGVLVNIAIATQYLYAFAGHPGGFFGAIQNNGGAILAHFAGMPGAKFVQVLAYRVAKCAAGLQRGVEIGDFALDELEFANGLPKLLAVVNIGHDDVHHGLHDA